MSRMDLEAEKRAITRQVTLDDIALQLVLAIDLVKERSRKRLPKTCEKYYPKETEQMINSDPVLVRLRMALKLAEGLRGELE